MAHKSRYFAQLCSTALQCLRGLESLKLIFLAYVRLTGWFVLLMYFLYRHEILFTLIAQGQENNKIFCTTKNTCKISQHKLFDICKISYIKFCMYFCISLYHKSYTHCSLLYQKNSMRHSSKFLLQASLSLHYAFSCLEILNKPGTMTLSQSKTKL